MKYIHLNFYEYLIIAPVRTWVKFASHMGFRCLLSAVTVVHSLGDTCRIDRVLLAKHVPGLRAVATGNTTL